MQDWPTSTEPTSQHYSPNLDKVNPIVHLLFFLRLIAWRRHLCKKESSSWSENQEEDSSSHLWEGYSQVYAMRCYSICRIRIQYTIYDRQHQLEMVLLYYVDFAAAQKSVCITQQMFHTAMILFHNWRHDEGWNNKKSNVFVVFWIMLGFLKGKFILTTFVFCDTAVQNPPLSSGNNKYNIRPNRCIVVECCPICRRYCTV